MQRMKKQKEEEEAERAEAEFVAQMEKIQVTKLEKAIFSPNTLSIMVLSSIASFCEKNNDVALSVPSENGSIEFVEKMIEEDDPLGAFKKRQVKSESSNNGSFKKQKLHKKGVVSSYCLAELLLFISKTWGHVYREPEHVSYAW